MTQPNYGPTSITRCEAITDLIESVAMEEKALAKILKEASEEPHHGGPGYDDKCSGYAPNYPGYPGHGSDEEKNEETIKLINAVARLTFFLTTKLMIFNDCACPKNGCKDHEGPRA